MNGYRHFVLLTACTAMMLSCGSKDTPMEVSPIETTVVEDSVGYDMGDKATAYSKIRIESPVGIDKLSRKNFDMWLSTILEREPSSDKDAVSSIAKAFVATSAANRKYEYESLDKRGKRYIKEIYETVDISKIWEDSLYVTYMFEEEAYTGGAHEMSKSIGYTFNRSDFSLADLIKPEDADYYMEEIAKELGRTMVSDPSKLMGALDIDSQYLSENRVPLPANGAFLVGDSLVFIYQEYEITSYNYGKPTAKIYWKKKD